MSESRPYTGSVDQMFGPGLYGYVDQRDFVLGDRGGMFLYQGATVSQESLTADGEQRIRILSDADDRLVITSGSHHIYDTVEEGGFNEGLVWVHEWRHESASLRESSRTTVFPMGAYGVGAKSNFVAGGSVRVQVLDHSDGQWKPWKLSREHFEHLQKLGQARPL